MNDDSSVSDAHSLTVAVADGTVTAEAAYCGLSPADVNSLADRHATLEVWSGYARPMQMAERSCKFVTLSS